MRGTTKSHFKMNQIPEGVENVATFRTHQSQASIALRLDHIKGSACQQALASATLDTRTLQPSWLQGMCQPHRAPSSTLNHGTSAD